MFRLKSVLITWFRKWLQPDWVVKSVYEIDPNDLERWGVKTLLIDIDNTLCERAKSVPDWKAKKLLREWKERGFKILLISNSSKTKRLIKVVEFLETSAIMLSLKPLPFIYKKLAKEHGVNLKDTAVIGDQLFTDILGGKLAGIRTIYTYPLATEMNEYRRLMIGFEKWLLKTALIPKDQGYRRFDRVSHL